MWYEPLLDRGLVPDPLLRAGIRRLLRDRLRDETAPSAGAQRAKEDALVRALEAGPIAIGTADANAQHYEVPAAFYRAVLGPRLKYSAGLWEGRTTTLAESEEAMLLRTTERARIEDGQAVLDLGCGWGSLTLYLAERFPRSRITAVSNASSQRAFIEGEAEARGLKNVRVITADINTFAPDERFDRVVSVEMLEHVRNHRALFERIASWLSSDGLFFAHIFCHRTLTYPFETAGADDWMARYFFTGGIMPSASLFHRFVGPLDLSSQWTVDGTHYERTANAWLARMDQKKEALRPLFQSTYGADADAWWQRWRIFFLSCAELFGFAHGTEWHVAHYLFRRG